MRTNFLSCSWGQRPTVEKPSMITGGSLPGAMSIQKNGSEISVMPQRFEGPEGNSKRGTRGQGKLGKEKR